MNTQRLVSIKDSQRKTNKKIKTDDGLSKFVLEFELSKIVLNARRKLSECGYQNKTLMSYSFFSPSKTSATFNYEKPNQGADHVFQASGNTFFSLGLRTVVLFVLVFFSQ